MNEVGIIINGVRYDAVHSSASIVCLTCDLNKLCVKYRLEHLCDSTGYCNFKKSDKKFEK